MAEPVDDALGILQQLASEADIWEAQNRARTQIKHVLETYKLAKQELSSLEETKKGLQASIDSLQERFATENAHLRGQVNQTRASVEKEVKEIQVSLQEARAEQANFKKSVEHDIETLSKMRDDLLADIARAQNEYRELSESIAALKKKFS